MSETTTTKESFFSFNKDAKTVTIGKSTLTIPVAGACVGTIMASSVGAFLLGKKLSK